MSSNEFHYLGENQQKLVAEKPNILSLKKQLTNIDPQIANNNDYKL